jgi:hypothetical protein
VLTRTTRKNSTADESGLTGNFFTFGICALVLFEYDAKQKMNSRNGNGNHQPKVIRYIDLFCGIGGFRVAINQAAPAHGVEWAALHFGAVKVETKGEQHIFEVQVCIHGLDPKAVRVELYADGVKGSSPVRQEMTLLHRWRRRVRQLHLQPDHGGDARTNRLYGASVTTL